MHLLHDALQASLAHLPAGSRADLAPLFARPDLLARLAECLFAYARHGVPDGHPPPTFSAELTPPPAESFAHFRPAVAAWHDAPDSPDVEGQLALALHAAGPAHVLALLGQRQTPATLLDARGFPPARETLLAAATRLHHPPETLTVVGRALTKHVVRDPNPFWGDVTGPNDRKNTQALNHLTAILDGTTWWNVFGHFQHDTVFEARLPGGHGARWGRDGTTFIGFLEPFDESLGVEK